uniref:DUF4220 domain-containing protein n=3 Tax=Triticum aestivum TaxID=4565 RepID=A0A3B6RRY7_WHEAT
MFQAVQFFIHIAEMRVLRNVQDVGGENLTGKLRLSPMRNLWNEWEIHGLVLASLALQFFLFFIAGMRRRSTSRIINAFLWLAYLSADSVAVFVLGHLAVRASGPQHELIAFWAPFLLVHLGGQDTITALSAQDNELWMRHLLGLVSQVAVAGYVVSKSSWPDRRLLAATVLIFLSGTFKYAGRTYCLYSARPAYIREYSQLSLSRTLWKLKRAAEGVNSHRTSADELISELRDSMLGEVPNMDSLFYEDAMEIMSVDAPSNPVESILARDFLPSMLEKFQSTLCLRKPYEHVGRKLVKCYENFYTKSPLLRFYELCAKIFHLSYGIENLVILLITGILWLTAILFQYLLTTIALVLFTLAEKGHQVHNRVDVTVSYILLIGAIILDVSSAFMSILSSLRSNPSRDLSMINTVFLHVIDCIQPTWSRKQWSEKIAQYSMVKRHTMEDTGGMSYVRQRIGKYFIAWGVELLDPSLTHTQVTGDLKEFVLGNLVRFGISKEYNVANFRGQLALQKCRQTALYDSIDGVKDFPTSILIWHIATDICYYSGSSSMTNTDCEGSKKKMCRELSNYIMYLVFKCGVMLTSNSQLVHNNVHGEMEKVLADQWSKMVNHGEEDVMKVFEGTKDEQPPLTVNENQGQSVNTDSATSSDLKKLLERAAEAIYSPVLPHASKVAQELMGIVDEGGRWDLIAAVWLEMLLYIAPRCGGAFHYQHLCTGGEFITHILLLMRSLGPFLPGPDNPAP